MPYKYLPDDALYTIYDALGRDRSKVHFGMPTQSTKDQRALVSTDRRHANVSSSPRERPDTCVCTAWICEHKNPPCYVAEGIVTSKREYRMCDLDEDKTCSFETIILAIVAASRRVIQDRAPQANRIVIWDDKKVKRSHARHGMNKESPILGIDLVDGPNVVVWYGTRIWYCSQTYGLLKKNGKETLVLHREEPCAKRPEYVNEQNVFVPMDDDWQRSVSQKLVHKAYDLLIASKENTGVQRFKGYLFLRKPKNVA